MYPFESLFQSWRIKKVLPLIKPNWVLVDVGCGSPPKLLQKVSSQIKYGIGIDEKGSYTKRKNIETFRHTIHKELKIESNSADAITLLAVLEHLKYPQDIISECYRILKPAGTLLVTVPTKRSQPILEFLSTLRLVDPHMIHQHENYFTPAALQTILNAAGFTAISISSFEMGCNTFIKAIK